jgi:hypothetical protein
MVYKASLRRLLQQLYQRRADIESLICFFEKYGKKCARRPLRPKRLLRVAS